MKTTILGIPIDLGAENLGVDAGPNAFRRHKIIEKLTQAGLVVNDVGNIVCKPRELFKVGHSKLKYLDEILRIANVTAKKIYKSVLSGEKVIVLGGDHALCLGSVSGASSALNGKLGLIYLDAHGDMNTTETTLTGNIHGMPLASLMGFGDGRLINVHKPGRKIIKAHMLHIGGTDFDPGEEELISKENFQMYKIIDMLSKGLKPLFNHINLLSKKVPNIWVSLDLDVIDEMYAPDVSMPNKAGFTYREITAISDYIGKNCNVVGVDIVEYNPNSDVDGKTVELGIELAANLLGGNYNWYTNYIQSNSMK